MRPSWQIGETEGSTRFDRVESRVLSTVEERELLRALNNCKRKLAEALEQVPGSETLDEAADPRTLAKSIAAFYAGDAPTEARLGAVVRRYSEIRGKLALANLRLVAHVARRFRDRGISYADLLQEGFCGLLEAIDRFDLNHETKLSTYATWWIRQSMQRAVASGAYPVKLSPRHLRQLAQSQDEIDTGWVLPAPSSSTQPAHAYEPSSELIHRIHGATRPTVSLDTAYHANSSFTLLQTMSDSESHTTEEIEMNEALGKLMQALRPREQEVLALRFGLNGKSRLSLRQVGEMLEVSKERVRQIQDRALEKLRAAAEENHVEDLLLTGV